MDEELRKLDVFVEYLIQHNRDHPEEIGGLAQRAKGLGEVAVCDDLAKGVEYMKRSNESLEHALVLHSLSNMVYNTLNRRDVCQRERRSPSA